MKLSDYSVNLKHKISLYIPSTINVNQVIDTTAYINQTETYFSKLFGGCTSIKACGNWITEKEELVKESVTIVYAFCSENDFLAQEENIIYYAKNLCKELAQECVSLEYDNELYFIS